MTAIGHIYMIITPLDNSFCYIGSTFNRLDKRFKGHKKDYKHHYGDLSIHEYFDKYGIENFKIIKIKSYNVIRTHKKDFKHLRAYETLWINKTKNCVNKQVPFQPLKKEKIKEYSKEHYKKNKEKIKDLSKEYYKENKEKRKKQIKEHYNNNKEKIKEYKKEYKSQDWYCSVCDKTIKLGSKSKHLKYKTHLSKIP